MRHILGEEKKTKLNKRTTEYYFYFQIKVKVNVIFGSENKYLSHFAWMSLVWCSPAHHEALSRLRPGFKSRYEHSSWNDIDFQTKVQLAKIVRPCMETIKTSPPISVTKTFELSKNKLWKLISSSGNLNNCHPFCKLNEVIQWDDNGHIDRLVYLNERTYVRHFLTWDEGEGYTLRIGEENGSQSFVEWKIEATSKNHSQLTITVHPYLLAKFPKLIAYLPYQLWIRPKMRRYLHSVVSGFEFVARTGEAVPRNHFGRHSWFS